MVILDWKITSPIFYRTQTFNAFCNFQYQTKVLFEILSLRCIWNTYGNFLNIFMYYLVVFYVYITIYSLWNVIQKKENSIFYTFMILHFFQTCIENSSHIPYFELFKISVFIFCARAYMQMQNWTKIYRCNVEKFALKTEIFFTKKSFAHTIQK